MSIVTMTPSFTTVDHRVARGLGRAEHHGGDGIVQRACIAQCVEIEREEIRALAGFQ
jgi:hypothetical protein